MRRIDTGVRQYGHCRGNWQAIMILAVSMAIVVIFLWWLGSLTFWHRQTTVIDPTDGRHIRQWHNAHSDFPECRKEVIRVTFHNKHHGDGAKHLRISYPCRYQR